MGGVTPSKQKTDKFGLSYRPESKPMVPTTNNSKYTFTDKSALEFAKGGT